MKHKYEIMGLDFNTWRNIKIQRDYDSEKKLFNILELNKKSEYNLINENHKRAFERVVIPVNGDENNIYMSKIDGFTMFDWLGVMENAKSIHTVGTSLVFLMDIYDTMPTEMHIYPRSDKPLSTYDYLLKDKYKFH